MPRSIGLQSLVSRPRRFARAWLAYYALFWALVPILDAQIDHGQRAASVAIVDAANPSASAPAGLCVLCDLLHSGGGTTAPRVTRAPAPAPTDPVGYTDSAAPHPLPRGSALSRAPPTV